MIVLGLVIFIFTLIFIWTISKTLSLTHLVQFTICIVFLIGLCTSANFIFGHSVMLYLINGLAIGLGIALQPLFKNIVNGLVVDSTKITKLDTNVTIGDITGKIKRVGMIHTWIQDETGNLIMINNDLLASTPLKLHSYKL